MKRIRSKKIIFTLGLIGLDMLLLYLSLYAAVLLRFDLVIPSVYRIMMQRSAPIIIPIFIVFIFIFRLYQRMWKYASIEVVFQVIFACVLAGFLSYFVNSYLNTHLNYTYLGSRGIYAIFATLSMIVIGGSRILMKVFGLISQFSLFHKRNAKRIMVVGAGWAGASTIRDIKAGAAWQLLYRSGGRR